VEEPKDSNQTDPLRDALAGYLTIPGMKAAILVSDQGLMISSIAQEGVDTASIAALAIDTVATVQRFGLQVQAGFLDTMRIEFDKLTVVLAPFATDVMLALVATAGSLGALSGDLTPGLRAPTPVGQPASGQPKATQPNPAS
jgi:predicted regulator of Ras-like GTPase activity (Roadblock/LC7/MglB family)